MRSLLSVARPGVPVRVDRAIEACEARYRAGTMSFHQFWESLGAPDSPSTLATLVKTDLQRRFELGERPRAAEYFEKYPILIESSDRVVSLVYEEFCLLQECNANPDSEEFCEAYAPWRDSIRSQLVYHRELSRAAGAQIPSVKFPSPGDRFDRYWLRSILGSGGVARVYLATEDDLGRKVAIKVSASFGQEPSILAKLDHRNIVPILRVTDPDESGLRGISMPYRVGVTLDELIRRIGRGAPPRSARAIWDFLRPIDRSEALPAEELRTGWEGFPIGRTFSEAVAWIGLALTNALSYLHGEGVLHRDIKPANVLLAYKEGPQLLDFNLAQDPCAPVEVSAVLKGGTLPYMAPEQLKAFLDPIGWEKVGAPADLYSMGLVLKELVTGQPPELPATSSSLPRGISALLEHRASPRASIREINPSVPPTLVSIIEKCLAVEPLDRYKDASELAEDLRCFLARMPLKHAPNPSKVERTSNWVYRNRPVLAALAFLVLSSGFLAFQLHPATPISAKVKQYEYLLDTNRRGDLEKARVIFEDLLEQDPNSAWPGLYLSRVLEKLGGKENSERAFDLIQEACENPDAEDALRNRLEKEPDSVNLRTNLGLKLQDMGKYLEARDVLLKLFDSGEKSFAVLLGLGNTEFMLQEDVAAVQHYSRAAQIGEPNKNIERDTIYRIHLNLLKLYVRLANRCIDHEPRQLDKAAEYVTQLEATLKAIRGVWKSMSETASEEMVENHKLNIDRFEGSLTSAQAVLAAKALDWDHAAELFEEAQCHFNSAHRTIETKLRNDEAFRKPIEIQERLLQARRQEYAPPSKVGPAIRVGGR